ncbi:MAG: L-threonylcarbamoyladenylate synthase [Candidatus Paceibacterota bacterium]
MEKKLSNKEVGVMLTDTIYGIVGLALDENVVQRIYEIKERDLKKPMVVLISSMEDLENIFGIKLNLKCVNILKELWSSEQSTSIVLPCLKFEFLHRGLNSLAFRIPKKKELVDLIKRTGPLIATSANKEGQRPALNMKEAKEYFADKIDFYIDEGESKKEPSILVKLKNENELEVLRGRICLKK